MESLYLVTIMGEDGRENQKYSGTCCCNGNEKTQDTLVDLFQILITPWQLNYRILCEGVFEATLLYASLRALGSTTAGISSSENNPSKFKKLIHEVGLVPNSTSLYRRFLISKLLIHQPSESGKDPFFCAKIPK